MTTRRRYRFNEATQQMEEIGAEHVETPRGGGHKSEEEIYGHLTTETGTDISTRKKHREYMRSNGLALHADFKETFARAQADREARRRGERPDAEVRESRSEIGRIAYELSQKRRR